MIKVAVIDDGIILGAYEINDLSDNISISSDLKINNVTNQNLYRKSHGTNCAGIIKKYYSTAVFSSIKILNHQSKRGTKDQLIKAIEWCLDNNIQVANISLGTIDYRDFDSIRNVINRACNKGLIIIAASDNLDRFTCPASCSNVIGVKSCLSNELKEGEYIFNLYPIDGIEVISCSEHELVEIDYKKKITSCCNSYAAPMITAMVCRIIEEFPGMNLEEIKRKLYERAINYSTNCSNIISYRNIDWIKNAALIIDGQEQYDFNLFCMSNISIFNNIEDINIDEFDTLIILKVSNDINTIAKEFEKKNKNIVTLDNIYKPFNNSVKFWSPPIIEHFFKSSLNKKKIDIPLILVYSDSKSGVLSLIKDLKYYFRNDGYNAGGISINPISILGGLGYIPMNKNEGIENLKDKLEMIYGVYDYDILILGIDINKKDINIIEQISEVLNPDVQVFSTNNLLMQIDSSITKRASSKESIFVITEKLISKNLFLGFEVLSYGDSSSLYNNILNIFTQNIVRKCIFYRLD